ncbi:MAG: NUDIX hydrolase [Paenibacillus sp. RIFOXYA1_FULL_44_5]|nr:MAG: NUDIX hydrolase [Paenibacillus sp. RIFOXYA1_FULL_44_5]
MKPIRNSAKAVIIQDGRLLLTKNKDHLGLYYLFPGGGQEKGEQLKDAVIRECIEEIGQQVEVQDLLTIREYIGKNHEFAEWDADMHQIEFYFACRLVEPYFPDAVGTNPDEYQVGVEWIEIAQLDEIRMYPRTFGDMIQANSFTKKYLGDAN